MGRKSKVDWGRADWSLRDVDIARALGCTRERVRQVRETLGKGKSPMWHKRVGTASERIAGMDTRRMTPLEVGEAAGCSGTYARNVLVSMGKAHVRPPDGRCVWKYRWGNVTPGMWREMTDKQVAEILGVENVMVVTQWRRRKGIMKRVHEVV